MLHYKTLPVIRPTVAAYEVQKIKRVPSGLATANPALEVGGGQQFFIQNFDSALTEIDRVNLGEEYDYSVPTRRFNP